MPTTIAYHVREAARMAASGPISKDDLQAWIKSVRETLGESHPSRAEFDRAAAVAPPGGGSAARSITLRLCLDVLEA